MAENAGANRDATVTDMIERIRSERFSDISRDLVLEILRLHADGMVSESVDRLVDEAIAKHTITVV